MSEEKNNSIDYLKKIEILEEKIEIIEENFKKNELLINEKTLKQQQNINSIKQDLYDVKKNNKKTKEHLLLELESSLDKHNQIQIRNDSYFKEFIKSFEEERANKTNEMNNLSENMGRLKQIIDEKDNLINNLKINQNELESTIKDYETKLETSNINAETLNKLKSQIDELNNNITTKEKEIQQAKQTINQQNMQITTLN